VAGGPRARGAAAAPGRPAAAARRQPGGGGRGGRGRRHLVDGGREFLDDWSLLRDDAERSAAVAAEPRPVEPRIDAYLAAVAEQLCAEIGLPAPAWVRAPGRFLDRFWWPGTTRALDALALRDSPAAFRRRGIFVGAGALRRV